MRRLLLGERIASINTVSQKHVLQFEEDWAQDE